jgi:hypothetical protein
LPLSDTYIIDALIVCKDMEGSLEHGEAAALIALVRRHGGFDDKHAFLRSRNPHGALWEAGFTVAQTCHVASAWEKLVYNLHFKLSDGRRSEEDDGRLTEELEWRCEMELEERRSAAAREQSELEELHALEDRLARLRPRSPSEAPSTPSRQRPLRRARLSHAPCVARRRRARPRWCDESV